MNEYRISLTRRGKDDIIDIGAIFYSALIAHRILVLFALGFLAHSSAEGLITSLDTSL